jgi:prephenate dehydrogenase
MTDTEQTPTPNPQPLATATVAVVGLGLMGGSLAAALRGGKGATRQCARVIGVVRQAPTAQAAREAGLVDAATTDLAAGVAEADIVVLAAPVRAILALIPQVGGLVKPDALVMDLGSSKAAVCAALGALPPQVSAVGGHPMCGKERGGLAAADATLYHGAPFVLVATERSSPAALEQAAELARAVGARPLVVGAARHDAVVAAISHVPFLMAVALVQAAAEQAATDDGLAWTLAAGGFRDTTRVAAGEVAMMRDTLLTNRAAVTAHLARAEAALETVRELIERDDEAGLTTYLAAAQEIRRRLFV